MKRILSAVLCVIVMTSAFTACNVNDNAGENNTETTYATSTAVTESSAILTDAVDGSFTTVKPTVDTPNENVIMTTMPDETAEPEVPDVLTEDVTVMISVEGFGDITLELYPDIAPITVANFVKLANEGFYDGLTFHRIYKGFMIQGGDPKGDGTGGSGTEIKGEFSANGVKNDLSHTRGVISMARGSHSMDSASSQFFICDADSVFLDGQYAAFGKVVDGMDVVDAVAAVEVEYNKYGEKTSPVTPPVIKSVTIVDVAENGTEAETEAATAA